MNVLLFDSHPRQVDPLRTGFERMGHSVVFASEPESARALLLRSRPAVLLVGVNDGDTGGFDLIRSLGRAAETRNLPCLAFGRPELRNDAVAAGAFGFLSLPVFVSDLIGACHLTAAAGSSGGRFPAEANILLKAEEIEGVYQLVRIFSAIGRSAVVEAVHGGKRAELRFVDGALTSVQVGALQGLAALNHLLLWERAELKVTFKNNVRRGSQLSLKPAEVLEECDRFLRDFAHEVSGLGSSRTVFGPNPSRRPAPNMPSEVVPVLKQFDGQRALAQVLEDSSFRIFDTLRIVKRFVADEAIIALPAGGDSRAIPSLAYVSGPAALDSWFQRSSPSRAVDGEMIEAGDSAVSAGSMDPRASTVDPERNAEKVKPDGSSTTVAAGLERDRTTTLRLVPREALRAPTTATDAPPTSWAADAAPAARSAAAPATAVKPPENVTFGEIRVPRLGHRLTPSVPILAVDAPSIVVDLGMSAEPVQLAVTASRSSVSAMPNMPLAGHPAVASVHSVAISAHAATAAAPAPALVTEKEVAAPPVAARAAAPTSATTAGRAASKPFDDVEADFFEREADLYRRDSPETFDDLEAAAHAIVPVGSNPQRKR